MLGPSDTASPSAEPARAEPPHSSAAVVHEAHRRPPEHTPGRNEGDAIAPRSAHQQRAFELDAETFASVREHLRRDFSRDDQLLVVLWHVERLAPAEIALLLASTESEVVERHDAIVARLRALVAQG